MVTSAILQALHLLTSPGSCPASLGIGNQLEARVLGYPNSLHRGLFWREVLGIHVLSSWGLHIRRPLPLQDHQAPTSTTHPSMIPYGAQQFRVMRESQCIPPRTRDSSTQLYSYQGLDEPGSASEQFLTTLVAVAVLRRCHHLVQATGQQPRTGNPTDGQEKEGMQNQSPVLSLLCC